MVSVIDPVVIAERGYRTLEWRDRDELTALGIRVTSRDSFPGLLLPMFRATGEPLSGQFKPAKPITIKGRAIKYLSSGGEPNHLDVHPRNRAYIRDLTVPMWITEGIKKSDSLTSRGQCVVTLTGVYNWRSKLGTLGDWEDVPLKGREVILCFDADARKNMNVARAMVRLGRWCRSKGAKIVRYLIVPSEVHGKATKGADDYFAAGGTIDALLAAATTTEPETEATDDAFTDARMAEVIADEVFADRFCWSGNLGWLRWDSHRWVVATEEAALEAVRQYALRRFRHAAQQGRSATQDGWHAMLKAARIVAVLKLAKGIVEQPADAFDADPDLMNTPGGVVDLRTGQVRPHDPDLWLTKTTRGSYKPFYAHPDWDQALLALRDDARPWFQVRVGQGITGHHTPDGVIPILQGTGENGKSCVTTDGLVPALGDYAAPMSPKLLMTRGEHSTERADLRGQRLLIAEELTEDRALNVTAIKQITDVGAIKARHVFKDNFTFTTTHSLLVTTNYIPVVSETDHGTWRRLALVVFPFTYRKPAEPLTSPSDRRGDSRLKARLRSGADGQHDAIVTWCVEGARRWYESGFPALPVSVDADTRAWRKQADRILGFWEERLAPDPDSCVLKTDAHEAFNQWAKENGHHEWSRELFGARFLSHTETTRHHVKESRPRSLDQSRVSRPLRLMAEVPSRPYLYDGVRFQAPGAAHENTTEDDEWSGWSEPLATSSQERNLGKVESSSDRLDRRPEGRADQECCEGGALAPECRFCQRSSTYFRREGGAHPVPRERLRL